MKAFYILLLTGLLSISALAILYFLHEKPVKNGFTRNKIYLARQLQVLDLKYNSWYINGLSANRIFLGNYAAPRELLSCNYNLKDTRSETIPFTFNETIDWDLAKMQVDSPWVYLSEYKTPSFVSAVRPFRSEKKYNLNGLQCDLMQVLTPNSLIVNGYSSTTGKKALQKISLYPVMKIESQYTHQTHRDRNFSIDGFMAYNKERGNLVFTYYYRNQFVCLDTNLNVLYTGKTIDTNSVAKIKIAVLKKGGKTAHTMAKPPLVVNKRGYSNGNFIYIHSGLSADNEKQADFEDHDVFDVYNTIDGKYSRSIYVPKYGGKRLRDFAVYGNVLIALYERYMVAYISQHHQ